MLPDFKSYTVKSNARRDMRKAGLGEVSHEWHESIDPKDGRLRVRPVFSVYEPEDVAHILGLGFDAVLKDVELVDEREAS